MDTLYECACQQVYLLASIEIYLFALLAALMESEVANE